MWVLAVALIVVLAPQFSAQDASVCGNGLCEAGESSSNCFVDCTTGETCDTCGSICEHGNRTLMRGGGTVEGAFDHTEEYPISPQASPEDAHFDVPVIETFDELSEEIVAETSDLQIDLPDSTTGYIVEFTDDAIMERKGKIQGDLQERRQELRTLNADLTLLSEEGGLFAAANRVVKGLQVRNKERQVENEAEDVEDEVQDYQEELREKRRDYLAKLQDILGDDFVAREFEASFNGVTLDINRDQASDLRALDFVRAVYPNSQVRSTLVNSVPSLGAPEVWDLGYTGKNVTIAVLDSGVDYTHSDFGGCFGDEIDRGELPEELPYYDVRRFDVFFQSEGLDFDDSLIAYLGTIGGIEIFDVTNPLDPLHISTYTEQRTFISHDVEIVENIAYIAENSEFIIVDVSEPHNPTRIGGLALPGVPWGVDVSGDYAYISTRDSGLKVVDISNLQNPQLVGGYDASECPVAYDVEVDGNYAFLTCARNYYELTALDITDPTNPVFAVKANSHGNTPRKVVVDGDHVFLIMNSGRVSHYNITNRAGIDSELGNYYRSFGSKVTGTAFDGHSEDGLVYVAAGRNGLHIIDVRNNNLTWRSEASEFEPEEDFQFEGVEVYGGYAFLADSFDGLWVVNVSDWRNPHYITDVPLTGALSITLATHANYTPLNITPNNTSAQENVSNNDCKVIGGWDFYWGDPDPRDDQIHGTHVAGIIASDGPFKGVAPDANIVAYKVLGRDGRGEWDDVIDAIEASLDPNRDGDYSDGVDIIHMSLGSEQQGNPDDPVSQASDAAMDAGVLVVVSAGNEGPAAGTVFSPGVARKVLTVGAIDSGDGIADFSARGPHETPYGEIIVKPDVLAPGVGICATKTIGAWPTVSCFESFNHLQLSGTSMSAPHVSGLAALLMEKEPDLTPEEIKFRIMQTAVDLGYSRNTQGAGKVHALRALESPVLITPGKLDLISGDFTVRNKTVYFNLTVDSFDGNVYTFDVNFIDHSGTMLPRYNGEEVTIGFNEMSVDFSQRDGYYLQTGNYDGVIILTAREDPSIRLQVFYTFHADGQGPNAENIRQGGFYHEGTFASLVQWETDDWAESSLLYRPAGQTEFVFEEIVSVGRDHAVDLTHLEPGTYEYYISSANIVGQRRNYFAGGWKDQFDDVPSNYLGFFRITIPEDTNFPENTFAKERFQRATRQSFATQEGIDMDHDGRPEMVVRDTPFWFLTLYSVYERQDNGSIELVHDLPIEAHEWASGHVWDIGDSDADGRWEYALAYRNEDGYLTHRIYEASSQNSFPEVITWQEEQQTYNGGPVIMDLDGDGKPEIVKNVKFNNQRVWKQETTFIEFLETTGDNQYQEVAEVEVKFDNNRGTYPLVQMMKDCGDLDGDGRNEMILAGVSHIFIIESTGDNSYEVTWERFITAFDGKEINLGTATCLNDIDRDGRREFMIGGLKLLNDDNEYYSVYTMFEAAGDDMFAQVNELTFFPASSSGIVAGDLDGDDREEIAIPVNGNMYVFTPGEYNQLKPMWHHEWHQNSFKFAYNRWPSIGDLDADGVNEIVFNELPSFYTSEPHMVFYQSTVEADFEEYRHVTLHENNCFVNLSVRSDFDNITLSFTNITDSCHSNFWTHTIHVGAGEEGTINVAGLPAGSYAYRVNGTGSYELTADSLCLDDGNDPVIELLDVPTYASGLTTITAAVADTNALDRCEVCVPINGTCLWSEEQVEFDVPDRKNGTCLFSWNSSNYEDGNTTVRMRVFDVGQNTANDSDETIVDNEPPTLHKVSVPSIAETDSTIDVTVNVTDVSPIVSVTAGFGSGEALVRNNVTGLFEGRVTTPSTAALSILAVHATDAAGNRLVHHHTMQIDERINWSDDIRLSFDSTSVAPQVVSHNGIHLVWSSDKDGHNEIYYSLIEENGKLAVYESQVSDTIYNSVRPAIAVANDVHIAWVDDRDGNKEIYYSKIGSVTEKRITSNVFVSDVPHVLLEDDLPTLLWVDSRSGRNELYIRSLDTQGNFITATEKLSTEGVLSYDAVIDQGVISVAYESLLGELWFLQADVRGSVLVEEQIGTGQAPSIAADSEFHVAWIESGALQYGVLSPQYDLTVVDTIATTAAAPDIGVDTLGNTHITWQSQDSIYYTKRNGNSVSYSPRAISNAHTPVHPVLSLGSTHIVYVDVENGRHHVQLKTTLVEQTPPTIVESSADTPRSDSITLHWSTEEATASVVRYGTTAVLEFNASDPRLTTEHEMTISGLDEQAQYFYEIGATDIFGNTETTRNQTELFTFSTEQARFRPVLPTTFYGAVTYQNGTPAEGLLVTATWIDVSGAPQTTATTTLSLTEALALGDGLLAGYFLFNTDEVQAREGSTINVSVPDALATVSVPATPGGDARSVIGGPVIVDASAPVITLLSPIETNYVTQNVTLSYTVNEPVEWVGFSLNGQDPVTITNLQEVALATRIGENTLVVTARDLIGLEGSTTVVFTVEDGVAPFVTVDVAAKVRGVAILEADVRDDTNPLAESCEVCISTDGVCDTEWVAATNDFTVGDFEGQCSYSWDTRTLSGQYSIVFKVNDITDNEGFSVLRQTEVDNLAPSAIENFAVQPVDDEASLTLSWSPSNAADFSHYRVYQSTTDFVNIDEAAFIAEVNETDLTETDLAERETYFYGVTAVDDIGNEGPVVTASATVADITPPSVELEAPQELLYNTRDIELLFTTSEPATCVARINGGDNTSVVSGSTIQAVEGSNDLELLCFDASGNLGFAAHEFTVDTVPPFAIAGITVQTLSSQNALRVSWFPSLADDFGAYHVYRSREPITDLATPVEIITESGTTTFDDTGLLSEVTYYYAVTAVDALGNEGDNFTVVSGTVADTVPPQINIVEPQDQLYQTSPLELLYTTDEPASCQYRFNGADEVDIVSSANITPLEGENTIDLICEDSSGNGVTTSRRFEADIAVPGPVTVTSVEGDAGSAVLDISWSASEARDLFGYNVYRSQTDFSDARAATLVETVLATTYRDVGLQGETTYYYAVTALDQYGNENTLVTTRAGTVADVVPPAPVEQVVATPSPDEPTVVITWQQNTDDDFSHYNVYRAASPQVLIATISDQSATSYTDANLTSGATYTYTITAVDANANEDTAVAGVTVTVTDFDPPVVTLVSPTETTYAVPQVSLQYSVNEPVTSCTYLLNGFIPVPVTATINAWEGDNTVEVRCIDLSGNEGTSGERAFTIDSTPPAPVTGVIASAIPNTAQISVVWDASSASDFDEYRIYVSSSDFTEVDSQFLQQATTSTSWISGELLSEQQYFVAITAVDTLGNENENVSTTSVLTFDLTPPPAVTPTVTPIEGQASMQLTWPASSASDLAQYQVYRSLSSFSDVNDATLLATTTAEAYFDSGLETETTYWYAVVAADGNGNTVDEVVAVSGVTSDTTPPQITILSPQNGFMYTSTSIQVSVSSNEELTNCAYVLNGQSSVPISIPGTIEVIEGNNGLLIMCDDLSGNQGSAIVNFDVDTIAPDAVTDISATFTNGAISLSWPANSAQDLSHYEVYRSTASFDDVSGMVPVASVGATSFDDTAIESETNYQYAVVAVDFAGNKITAVGTVGIVVPDIRPPVVSITSPTAQAYGEPNVTLEFSADEPTPTCWLSLNGAQNDTATSGMIITGTEGENTVVVTCFDEVFNAGAASVTFTIDRFAPDTTTGLIVTTLPGQASLQVSWSPSTANDFSHYNIYRSDDAFSSTAEMTVHATGQATSFIDTNLDSERTYYYAVTAVDIFNNENTNVTSVAGTVADLTPPLAISGLTLISLEGQVGFALSWNPGNESDIDLYNVYRADASFTNVTGLSPVLTSTSPSTQDVNVEDGRTYYYAVTAVDTSDNEYPFVESVSGSLPDVTAPDITVNPTGETSGIATLTATVSDSGGLASCDFCVSNDGSCVWEEAVAVFSVGDRTGLCSYTWDTTSLPRTTYTYNFRVHDEVNNSREGIAQSVTVVNETITVDFSVSLVSGWNLFSLPVSAQSMALPDVLSSIDGAYKRVFAFDAASQSWLVFNPALTVFDIPNTLFQLEVGKSYWIEMTSSATLSVSGQEVLNPSIALRDNWNFIGLPGLTALNMSEALAGLSYAKIYSYDASQDKWDVFSPTPSVFQPNTLTTMEPGKGYVIDMTEDQGWSP